MPAPLTGTAAEKAEQEILLSYRKTIIGVPAGGCMRGTCTGVRSSRLAGTHTHPGAVPAAYARQEGRHRAGTDRVGKDRRICAAGAAGLASGPTEPLRGGAESHAGAKYPDC